MLRKDEFSSQSAFTLVEIMIVVATIALLAAIALPVYRRLIETSMRTEMLNDGRQIAAAAQHYMLEKQTDMVTFSIGSNGKVDSPLGVYVKQVGRSYSASPNISLTGTFTLAHSLVNGGVPLAFNAEGQLYVP